MKFTKLYLPIIVILVFSLIAAGCSKSTSSTSNGKPPHLLTEAEFQAEVLDYEGVVLVDFSANWCHWCKKISPELDKLQSEMGDKIKVVKLYNDDKGADLGAIWERYDIQGIPDLRIFKNGKEIDQEAGYKDFAALKKWVEKYI